MYGPSYLRLNKVQEETLNVLNRSAMRVITGLPKFTPIAKLEKAAQVNKVREIADEMVLEQLKRLSRSDHGRVILRKLEKTADLDTTAIAAHPPPPWEREDVSTGI